MDQTENKTQPATANPDVASSQRKERRKTKLALFGQAKDRALDWLASSLHGIQVKFAVFMNRKTRGWKRSHQRLFLVLFVIGTQLISFSILFFQRTDPPPAMPKPAMHMGIPTAPLKEVSPRLTRSDSANLVAFRKRLDQLMSTPAGRDSVAAFNRQRPGFIDSVLALEDRFKHLP